MTLKASVQTNVGSSLSGSATVGSNKHDISKVILNKFAEGVAVNQAEEVYAAAAQLAASAVDSLDLAGGVSNSLGDVLTLTSVKALIIEAASTNQGTISVGGNASPFASFFGDPADTLVLKPGGSVVLVAPDAAGYAVTPTTADVLDITNNDGVNVANYTITVIGTIS